MLCVVNWVHGRVCSLLWVYRWVCYRCRYGVVVCHVLCLWIHGYILRLDTCIWLTMRDRDIGEGNGWLMWWWVGMNMMCNLVYGLMLRVRVRDIGDGDVWYR